MRNREKWRDVIDFDGRYLVSNLGRIANARFCWEVRGRPMGKRGHLRVDLGADNPRYIAHLVLEAFVGLRREGHVVYYKDDDVANVLRANLRWIRLGANKRRNAAMLALEVDLGAKIARLALCHPSVTPGLHGDFQLWIGPAGDVHGEDGVGPGARVIATLS